MSGVPITQPPSSMVQRLPPTVAPFGEFDTDPSPPLPELPEKTYRVHHDPLKFPTSIFDRIDDMAKKPRKPAKDIQPQPGGRWLHTIVELEGMVFMYGGVISPKTMLNDLWVYTPGSETWFQKQRLTLPILIVPPNDKFKIDPDQGRPAFAPEPPDMRQMPAPDAGAKVLEEMDPDGGMSPLNPDDVDPDESLPIYVTPPIPVLNPQQPYTLGEKTAMDGTHSDGDNADAGLAGGLAGGAMSMLGGGKKRRRRRMLSLSLTEVEEEEEERVEERIEERIDNLDKKSTSNLRIQSASRLPKVPNSGKQQKKQQQPGHPWGALAPGLPSASALHGGKRSQESDPIHYVDDFWLFDVQSDSWLMINPHEGANPPRRSLHTAVSIGTKMIIFGGVSDSNILLNDIWTYDVNTRMWEEVVIGNAQDVPLPREGHVMVAGPTEETSSFTIHGGMGYGYVPYEDTWTFDLPTGTWTQVAVVRNIEEEWVPDGRWMHSAVTIDKVMWVLTCCFWFFFFVFFFWAHFFSRFHCWCFCALTLALSLSPTNKHTHTHTHTHSISLFPTRAGTCLVGAPRITHQWKIYGN